MPKPHTFPTLYDEVKTVSISFLIKHEYLKPNQLQKGTITWSSNGIKTGSISISVNTFSETPYLELNYQCKGKTINYRVQLVRVLSNLGKGFIWYFVCPKTNKLCRKLYMHDTYFYHRTAIEGGMYSKQTYSKLGNAYEKYFSVDELYKQLNQKHFKSIYAGKPTKRYLKLTQQIRKAESVLSYEV